MKDIFTDDGSKVLDNVFSNKCMHAAADTLNYAYSSEYRSLINPQPKDALAWAQALIKGSVRPVKPMAPVACTSPHLKACSVEAGRQNRVELALLMRRNMSMLHRIAMTAVVASLPFIASSPARAQAAGDSSTLSVHLFPYLWLPMVDTDINHPVLGGGTASTAVSTGPADYIPKLHFGAMLAGEVDYDRLSLSTDILYLSVGASGTKLTSFNSGTTAVPLDQLTTHVGTNLQSTVWTMAGGYTLAKGSWGNVDVLAGIRLLAVNDATDFGLSASVTRPDGTVALGRTGNLTAGRSLWNGIGGVRGRFYIGDADWFGGGRFFIPYYFDIGGGGARPTWQIFSGIGYQTQILGLSIGYRYLAFDEGGDAVVQKMTLRGPILAGNISF